MLTRSEGLRIARLLRECDVDHAPPLLLAGAACALGAWLLLQSYSSASSPERPPELLAVSESPAP